MEISKEEFQKIAKLARLNLSEQESEEIRTSMENFVEYLDKLKDIDTEGVEPMMRVDESEKPLRSDVPGETLSAEQAFKNAPSKQSGHFSIPKTVK